MALDKNDLNQVRNIVVEAIELLVVPRFDEHDKRFDRLETRMDNLETRMDNLETRMDNLEVQMDSQEQTTRDLKTEMRSGFAAVNKRIDELSQDLNAKIAMLEADIKEIYLMLAKLQKKSQAEQKFAKLALKDKLLQVNQQLLITAKEAGVSLPRTESQSSR